MQGSNIHQFVNDLIKKGNTFLYTVSFQHYTNVIEGYFNIFK